LVHLIVIETRWLLPARNEAKMTTLIPTDPNMLLRRQATAEALTAVGYPTAVATLTTKASRGGGPVYRLFGTVVLYRWGDALAWAEGRLSPLRGLPVEAPQHQDAA
jgi:hypothetical protein